MPLAIPSALVRGGELQDTTMGGQPIAPRGTSPVVPDAETLDEAFRHQAGRRDVFGALCAVAETRGAATPTPE